jgi:hypothetical protein
MLQKPYLSRYEFNLQNYKVNTDFTVRTKAGGESSDDDEYHLDGTILTDATESSDDDEYIIGSTSRKKSIGDQDEYYCFGTTITRTLEDSDPDFFLVQKDN